MKKEQEKINVVYLCVKEDEQNDLEALQTQKDKCTEYLARQGLINTNVFFYNEIQIGSKKPILESIKTLIKAGRVNTVTATTFDKLFTSLKDFFDFMLLAIEHKVEVNMAKYYEDDQLIDSFIDEVTMFLSNDVN